MPDNHMPDNHSGPYRRLLHQLLRWRSPANLRQPRLVLTDQPAERTTAATNVLLAGLAARCGLALYSQRQPNPWKASLWSAAFGSLTGAATLGAVAHGLKLSPRSYAHLWKPLNLALGTTIALFVTGAIDDSFGQQVARRMLPLMLLAGGGFVLYTWLRQDDYTPFVIFQTGGMTIALGLYSWLAWRKRRGAAWMVAGISTSMLAGGLQTRQDIACRFIWEFDHNGIYHLIQLIGLGLLYQGVRRGLNGA